jgi:hypothetical protein
MQAEDGAEEDAPEEIGPSAKGKKQQAEGRDRDPMPLADPDVEFIFAKVGDVREERGRIVVHGLAGEKPADVSPETAFVGRVRVAFFVGVLMMHAVDGDPEDRSAFQGERGANGEEVFHPSGGFVASVGEKPVIAHANAEASSDPPQQHGD